ncbi:MAG TPA: DUF2948 family protein [Rhizomicrobium sp.]|jgi:hypothetical protein|nr:DUF2948 family protein [Rhizomicrobium sp.]
MNGSLLKLGAADSEDLEILSARLQDATARLKDIAWLPRQRRFAALFNRYRWEDNKAGKGSRVRAGLRFDGVRRVESQNIKRGAPDAVVSLLAIKFTPNPRDASGLEESADPGGTIELVLAGGGAFRLTVECIDAELSDLTGPWEARGRPMHDSDR